MCFLKCVYLYMFVYVLIHVSICATYISDKDMNVLLSHNFGSCHIFWDLLLYTLSRFYRFGGATVGNGC